ncbi:MAG: gliding motility-associated C-terminal domain-containing protein [Cryomorphaceae bacterium]|jgi:hypothetical protein|nr:gliding motility-associated C-terminal domain-containing protein [Cryomorphaceae bacterium]
MSTVFFTAWLGFIALHSSYILGQTKTPNTPSCIYIPNNISVRCDDYNKDFTLEISSASECRIQKMEVISRWGNILYSTEAPPWEWYGGKEAAGTYNVVVTYSEEAGEIKTSTQSVYVIK